MKHYLATIFSALRSYGFTQVEQRVESNSTLWSNDFGVSAVVMPNGVIRFETLRDVRVVRCVNLPLVRVRERISTLMQLLQKEK